MNEKTRRPARRLMLPAVFGAMGVLTPWSSAAQIPDISGTYQVALCRIPCVPEDTARAAVVGVVVLGSEAGVALLAEDVRARLARPTGRFGGRERRGRYNGCFALDRRIETRDFYAGMIPAGFLVWYRDAEGRVVFELYRSPDAGFEVTATPSGDTLVGDGVEWFLPELQPEAIASVRGVRIGDASFQPCTEAVKVR